jgi:hypothetical protein
LGRERVFLIVLAILLVTSVVSLSVLGVQNLGVYLSLFSLCYYANSFFFRPNKRTIDFVGLGLLYYTGLFLATAFKVL